MLSPYTPSRNHTDNKMSVIFKDSGTFRDYFLWFKPKTKGKQQLYCSKRPVFYRQLFAKALAGSSPKVTPISPAKLPGPTPISIFGATITLFRDRKAASSIAYTLLPANHLSYSAAWSWNTFAD